MKIMLQEISGQSIKEYLWPDVKSSKGKKTALIEGGVVSLALAIIYSVQTVLIYKNGATLPEELDTEVAEMIDVALYSDIKILLNLIAVATALFYIRSVAVSRNKISIVFLVLWTFFEVYFEYSNGLTIMLVVYGLLFLGSINAYRTMRSLAQK